MLDDLKNYFSDKKILILGFGREGKSTYNFLRKVLPEQKLFIADIKEIEIDDNNVELICGENYLDNLDDYDLIVKTPGVSFLKVDTTKIRDKITSQTELFLQFFRGRTIGITGTKGKSTTSSLIYQILHDQGVPCRLLGNIGVPVFDFIEELDENSTAVLEMSSAQLEFVHHSPQIAIYLDVFEEHLDFHGSFENYANAKANIFRFQNENDVFLYGYDNVELRNLVARIRPKAKTYRVSRKEKTEICLRGHNVKFLGKKIYDVREKRNLLGEYNVNNIMFALGVARVLNLDLKKAQETVNNFKSLPHRLEFVGEILGIKFYDNAIATIPEATIAAVEALKDVDTLIIGGKDRGVDFFEFIKYLNHSEIRNVICMPTTGMRIGQEVDAKKVRFANNMTEAVSFAKILTTPGKSCLLSPAAASYDFYKNFEEKGDEFQRLVRSGK